MEFPRCEADRLRVEFIAFGNIDGLASSDETSVETAVNDIVKTQLCRGH
jgi:hypothetical protein